MSEQFRRASAMADFRHARQQAAIRQVLARLQGRSTELLSYDRVMRQLGATGSAEKGLHDIPLDAIAGSVGRPNDFTRDFLPRHDSDLERWAKVRMLAADPGSRGLPPIQVYRIGQAYFILDGHHRVSVARQLGATTIQAYVTEVHTRVPLSAQATAAEVIAKSESLDFMESTGLAESHPKAEIAVSEPGEANLLAAQVEAHRQALQERRGGEVLLAEAAADWYDAIYMPVVEVLREQGLPRLFPDQTEADLYLLVSAHRQELAEALGWEITTELSANDLAVRQAEGARAPLARAGRRLLEAVMPEDFRPGPEAGSWRRGRTLARYGDRLFADILVAVTPTATGWAAVDLALALAQREGAQLHGLHVVPTNRRQGGGPAQAVRERFSQVCQAAGVTGALAVEVGEVARTVCARAGLSDLVVLGLAHPPSKRLLDRLGSGFRNILHRCPRPVLAVPRPARLPARLTLAYDGSPKSKEALFVAAYFAETWGTALTVVMVAQDEVAEAALSHARAYLDMHEVTAVFDVREAESPGAGILAAAAEAEADLIVMGGYSDLREAMLGSTVDHVLRATRRPVLICQ